MISKNRAVAELILAGIIWGASFMAAKFCLESFSTYNLLMSRFFVAFTVGIGIMFVFKRKITVESWKNELRHTWLVGLFLGLTLWLQTYGLNFTSATKSSFITSLYVVLIPVIMILFFRQPSRIGVYGAAVLALVGMYFLVDPQGGEFNRGDVFTLGCAITSSFHIIYTGWNSKKSQNTFLFNVFQNLWSFVFILPFFFLEKDPLRLTHFDMKVGISFFVMAIGCSMIGFFLQVRAQKVLSTQLSSMLCLLEGPFATLFAFTLGAESLTPTQFMGAAIILGSCYLAVYLEPKDMPAPPHAATST